MTDLIGTALWVGFLCLAGWRLERVLAQAFSLADRALELKEKATTKPVDNGKPEIPADLYLYTLGESEGWAREQAQKLLMEKYADLGSWDAVREVMRSR